MADWEGPQTGAAQFHIIQVVRLSSRILFTRDNTRTKQDFLLISFWLEISSIILNPGAKGELLTANAFFVICWFWNVEEETPCVGSAWFRVLESGNGLPRETQVLSEVHLQALYLEFRLGLKVYILKEAWQG